MPCDSSVPRRIRSVPKRGLLLCERRAIALTTVKAY